MLQSLEKYTIAQKGVGTYFIVFGIVFFFFTLVVTIIVGSSSFLKGLNWGSFFSGIFLAASGIIYRSYCDMVHKKAAAIFFKKGESEFVKAEFKRMEKVEKEFIGYQIAFSFFSVLSVIIGLFLHSRVARGVLIAVAVMFAAMLVIEYLSRHSITNYTQKLRQEIDKIKRSNIWRN